MSICKGKGKTLRWTESFVFYTLRIVDTIKLVHYLEFHRELELRNNHQIELDNAVYTP